MDASSTDQKELQLVNKKSKQETLNRCDQDLGVCRFVDDEERKIEKLGKGISGGMGHGNMKPWRWPTL